MGLHLLLLAKLKLVGSSHRVSPLVASLVSPYVIKLSFCFKSAHEAYAELAYAARLFFFQLGQIAFETESGFGNGNRLERALRLICERVAQARRWPAHNSDEENMHTLSMLSL